MDEANVYVYLRVGDCLMLCQREKEALSSYTIALEFLESDLNPHQWLIQFPVEFIPYRPASIQFELLSCLLNKLDNFIGPVFPSVYKVIGKLYDSLLDAETLPPDMVSSYIQKLAFFLQRLPIQEATIALYAVASDDLTRLAHLVLLLAPHSPHSLSICIRDLLHKEFDVARHTDLALDLYQLSFAYDLSWEERELIHVRILMAQRRYGEAEPILSLLVQISHSEPDVFWFLDEILQHYKRSPEQRVAVLQRFLELEPTGQRAKEVALRIGNLYSMWEGKSIEAINAYQQAERLGAIVEALHDFRCGNWDTERIPVLRAHPDYAFLVVVVLDLECDYKPDAPPGSRVFEIGAVRMKGRTELDRYHAIIQRDFVDAKVADTQDKAQSPGSVIQALRKFIGSDVVIGHNLKDFDAPQLHGMGLKLSEDQRLDTLVFARLLYPDSIHHSLRILCEHLEIDTDYEWHHALNDARACAVLFHELGEELVRRGDGLIAGFRAFTLPNSAFDQAVLQPRKIAADPKFAWKLCPSPMPAHALIRLEGQYASANMLKALHSQEDILVEHYDPDGAYIQALPHNQRNLVTVGSRSRLERMLTLSQTSQSLFVLPHPQTLLCPQRMSEYIEKESNSQEKLRLFCLYQASHNHDASTLYSLRLRLDDSLLDKQSALQRRNTLLLHACCGDDHDHVASCPAFAAVQHAIATLPLLITTHKDLLAWRAYANLSADLIIVDNAEELQMHFVEYLAEYIDSDHLTQLPLNGLETEALQRLEKAVQKCAKRYVSRSGMRERLPLQVLAPALTAVGQSGEKSVLSLLEEAGPMGRHYALQLKQWCIEATQDVPFDNVVRAYWLDLQISIKQEIERWSIGRICLHIPTAFQHYLGKPYARHIICGTAITLGTRGTTFLTRYFDLQEDLVLLQDERPPVEVLLPHQDTVGSASFLRRRSWAVEVGSFLYHWLTTHQEQSMMLTLNETSIAYALIDALKEYREANPRELRHQLLSPRLKWSLSKIVERVENPEYRTLTIVTPTTRRTTITTSIAVEATGPLRFLNRRDPLVAAHMRAFKLYEEGSFHAYLLPQALLELKTRLASPAQTHIILDGALRSRMYYDDVCSLVQLLQNDEAPRRLARDEQEKAARFKMMFEQHLKNAGFNDNTHVTKEDLYLTLQSLWHINEFKVYQREDGTTISQKDIISTIFADKEKRDQLVVVATGGGKSLCFQLPAVLLAEDVVPRVTLVFSPLIALMRDQLEKLHKRGLFSAIVLNSELSSSTRADYLRGIKNGDYSIVYMAPEQLRSGDVCAALQEREIGLIAIDEAHCVSQWGHDFRTEYFALKQWINKVLCHERRREFPLIALTATARRAYQVPSSDGVVPEVSTVQDIIDKLGLQIKTQQAIITSPERPELVFQVEPIHLLCRDCRTTMHCIGNEVFCPSCDFVDVSARARLWQTKCHELMKLLSTEAHRLRKRWDRVDEQYQRGIIYCRTRAATEQLAHEIANAIPALNRKIAAYHAGMLVEDRKAVYTRFINDDVENGLRIVVATNAFGMGVDAERLGFVIHFDVPATPEAYYQEAGRAGRNFKDGETAQCILLYHDLDLESQRWMTSQNKITEQDVLNVYDTLCMLRQQKPGDQELLVTEEEIALLAGVDPDQVDTLLYYLEYHTTIDGTPILQREENISHVWEMRFTADYQQSLASQAHLSTIALHLLTIFQEVEPFRFSTTQDVRLDLNELMQYLNQQNSKTRKHIELNEVKKGLIDLINAGCLLRITRGRLLWKHRSEDIDFMLEYIKEELVMLLDNMTEKQDFYKGETVNVKIEELIDKYGLNALSSQCYARFLFTLSQESKEDEQLFHIFKKDVRYSKSGQYSIQLKCPAANIAEIATRVERIFAGLQRTFKQIKRFEAAPETFDPFCIARTYKERQQLHRHLLWLEMFDLLSYKGDVSLGQARKIKLLHIEASDHLYVDLGSLYIQEAYREKKLSLMKTYVDTPYEKRLSLFKEYFLGIRQLLTPYSMPAYLTVEQQEAAKQAEGYCLVEGLAGSGKTRVLLEHIRYLLHGLYMPAERIIVLAHYKSAIWSILSMIEAEEVSDSQEQMPEILTFNAFANRIFKDHRMLLKRSDGYLYYSEGQLLRLLTDTQQPKELQSIHESLRYVQCNGLGQEINQAGFPLTPQQERLPEVLNDKIAAQFLQAIKYFRQSGIFPACFPQQEEITLALSNMEKSYDVVYYYAVYVAHLMIMGEKGWYTYDDQILFALALLRAYPHLRDQYNHYKHILIDEFQDTTYVEREFLRLLAPYQHHILFALGDSKQDIWVRAIQSKTCISKFGQITNVAPDIIYLSDNFRAAPELQAFLQGIATKRVRESIEEAYNQRGESIAIYEHAAPSPQGAYNSKKIDPVLLHKMIDIVIAQHSELPTNNSTALIVAYSPWLKECRKNLNGRYPFLVAENTLYQAPHIERILLYLRLIADKKHDDDIRKLLHFCLVPKLLPQQIHQLKDIAQKEKLSWFDILRSEEIVKQLFLPRQRRALQPHLALIQEFSLSNLVDDVWQALEKLKKSPIASLTDQNEQLEEQQKILQELQQCTVMQALHQVKQHLSFMQKQEAPHHLILTTINNAKSQEFDNVFLLGADALHSEERFYAGVSRAKQRLFLLVEAQNKSRRFVSTLDNSIPSGADIDESNFLLDELLEGF